jgi:hypothetical protein
MSAQIPTTKTQPQFSFLDDTPLVVDPAGVTINPDGSVKGCKTIYAPRGQANEYAPLACNIYDGCGHSCAYPCWVPKFTGQPRAEFNAGAVLKPHFFADLRQDAARYKSVNIIEQVLLCFTTDPYHPGDTLPTRKTIEILIEHGLAVCTLTKGGTRALRDLDLFRPKRDAYATTLTSLDDRLSRKWESKAPLPGDRVAALKRFHDAGIFTWVSLEPLIDPDAALGVVAATHPFVDLYKLGRLNHSKLTPAIDYQAYADRMLDLLNRLGAKAYFKKDLQPFLPPGYLNPMRVVQCHPNLANAEVRR